MALENYKRIIDEICTITMIPNPASMYEMAGLTVRDIDFSVIYQDSAPSGEVLVCCDYGALPLKNRDAVMRRLLEINFYLFIGERSPSLSINPDTDRVVLSCSQPMDYLTAQGLLDYMGHLAEMALEWRDTSCIKEKEANAKPLSKRRL